jgi:hypothetical protein
MLIPTDLWRKAARIAKREKKNMTELVCEGLTLLIASRNPPRKDKTNVSDAYTPEPLD